MKFIRSGLFVIVIIAAAGCGRMIDRVSLLVGDESLHGFFSQEKDSVTMYASPPEKKKGLIECRVYQDEYGIFTKMFRVLDDKSITNAYRAKGVSRFSADFIKKIQSLDEKKFRPGKNPSRPLEGLRVAIDPGHNAADMKEAIREQRYMWLYTPEGKKITFFEAELNLATSLVLKEMLEKDGATVMLTRNTNGQVSPIPCDTWIRRDFRRVVMERLRDRYITRETAERLLTCGDDRARVSFFNSEIEMPFRAKMMNAFRPHLSLFIHYNAWDDKNAFRSKYLRIREIIEEKRRPCTERLDDILEAAEYISETDRNFCSVFIPGSFLRGELDNEESRIEFLRLIISDDMDLSAHYSEYCVRNFKEYLKVPASGTMYPGVSRAVPGMNGVYARNFRFTRLVRGALCLGEPLLQNNMREALQLAEISGGKTPPRVTTVARAYHDAVKKYAERHMTARQGI